jgi:exopolysaccharide production protein ExoZ
MRIQNVQALRAVAALMVIGDHLPRLEAKLFPSGLIAGWGAAGAIGVDLFFVISGFIMVVTSWEAFGAQHAGPMFLLRRIMRIFPIYWIATFTDITIAVTSPRALHTAPLTPMNILTSLFLIPQHFNPIVGVAWSLQFEMFFYLVFALVLAFTRSRLAIAIGTWIVVTFALNIISFAVPTLALQFLGSPLSLEFIAGMIIGILAMRGRFAAPRTLFAVGGLLMTAVCVYSSRFDGFGSPQLEWYRVVCAGPAVAMLVYGAVGLEERFASVAPRALVTLGDASYSMYLWHGMILGAFTTVFARLHPHGRLFDFVFLILGYIIVTLGSLATYRLIEKPLIAAFRNIGRVRPRAASPPGDTIAVPQHS